MNGNEIALGHTPDFCRSGAKKLPKFRVGRKLGHEVQKELQPVLLRIEVFLHESQLFEV
jgi:hypothetical protein